MSGWANEYLKLPAKTLAGDRRIAKTLLAKQGNLAGGELRVLDKVRRLEHHATVQKSTAYIAARVDEEHDVQAVIFLDCEMAGDSKSFAEVARVVHGCFPNPTVIAFESADGKACLSVALTRRSLAERGAIVVDKAESTGSFDPRDPVYQGFLEALTFDALDQGDLYAFAESIATRASLARAASLLGFYPAVPEDMRAEFSKRMDLLGTLQSSVRGIEEKHNDKNLSFNEKCKLRMELKDAQKKRDAVVHEIKELCDGRD